MSNQSGWWLLGAAVSAAIALGAGGAQAAGGALDSSFGSGGKVRTDLGADDFAYGVVVQSDGKIVAAGSSGAAVALARYSAAGRLDASFGRGGKLVTDLGEGDDWADAVVVQAGGRIVAAGCSDCESEAGDFALVRYTADGRVDRRFGRRGVVRTDLGAGSDDQTGDAVRQADGKIVVVGSSDAGDTRDFALVRYTADGAVDQSFGRRGIVLTDFDTYEDQAWAVAIQKDGKIVAAGPSGTDEHGPGHAFAVARYTSRGVLDASFGRGGKVRTYVSRARNPSDYADAVAIQADGKIVVAGTSSGYDFAVVRYTPGGKLDPSFGRGGKVLTDVQETSDFVTAVAIRKDGKIVVVGSSEARDGSDLSEAFALVRYTTGGELDRSFGTGGKVLTHLGWSSDASAAVLQPDGKIVAAGSAQPAAGEQHSFALARYRP